MLLRHRFSEQLRSHCFNQLAHRALPVGVLCHVAERGGEEDAKGSVQSFRDATEDAKRGLSLVAFDAREERFRWDVGRIREKGFTDNVIELMVAKS